MLRTNFDFTLAKGDFCFVVGESGSWKTSLMKLITRQIMPPPRTVHVYGDDVSYLHEDAVQDMRRHIGVVYQDYKLLSDRSVLENIILPLQIQDAAENHAKERAETLLQEFGFRHELNIKVSLLSGWEKQKVAIMRALSTSPELIIADEPTGNLDQKASRTIADMLIHANKQWHTILFITHDVTLIQYVQSIYPQVRVVNIE